MKKYTWALLTFTAFAAAGCNLGVSTSHDLEEHETDHVDQDEKTDETENAELAMYKSMHDKYDTLLKKMETVMGGVKSNIEGATGTEKANLTLKVGTIQKIDVRLHIWHQAYENIDMGEEHQHDHSDHDGHDHGSAGNLKLYEFPEQQRKLILNSLAEELEKMGTELAAAI